MPPENGAWEPSLANSDPCGLQRGRQQGAALLAARLQQIVILARCEVAVARGQGMAAVPYGIGFGHSRGARLQPSTLPTTTHWRGGGGGTQVCSPQRTFSGAEEPT